MSLDDTSLLERFQRRELGPGHFDHRGHLRLAWLHLQRYPLPEAIARVCVGIRELAARFGAAEKYHHTVTEALLRIMAVRLRAQIGDNGKHRSAADLSFADFLAANPDLLSDTRGVLATYYSEACLHSPPARSGWVEPDRRTIA